MEPLDSEARMLNGRVAELLGWSGLRNADAYIEEARLDLKASEYLDATASGWFGWAPGAKGPTTAGGVAQEGADKEPVPDFCRDARAAELIIEDIERRGGEVDFFSRVHGVHGGIKRKGADIRFGLGGWHRVELKSLWRSLAVAYIAAREAEAQK